MGNKISCSTCNPKPLPQSRASAREQHAQSLRRDGHVLRLWAEVFHVSASSGAVRWTQLSDDLVPISVSLVNGRFHVTAYNSRVDKVLDTWLSCTRLGQASNCFVYWKDAVTGDTWGLNFTSAADARAFRECISAARDFRRAESSYSLRDGHAPKTERGRAGRAASQPNSPSKQKHAQQLAASECTCDCMTSDALHKARNGRIRYATFARQDSNQTNQSSKSDGSLVRRQHERQQYFANRGHVRSMEEQMRAKCQRQMQQTARRQDDGRQTTRAPPTAAQLRSKSTEDVRRVATTSTTTDDLMSDRTTTATTTANTMSSEALKRMLRDVTTTTTASPTTHDVKHDRPKSLSEMTPARDTMDRSRSHRSLEGRRRSLERSQCVDFTDASPPTPRHRPTEDLSLLDQMESELRRRLTTRDDSDPLDAYQTLLKESMDDVATLMREVQHELSMIRAEERRFKSLSAQSLLHLSRSSAPILDTLSIDGQLPFCTLTGGGHSTHALPFESLSIASMMTSSEVSDDEKASLTTAISDDDDIELRESPMRARSGTSAANFECLGAIRKSGFLFVKKWLLRKKHSLELARKRGWKRYWVSLKGTTLLFYNCRSDDGHAIDAAPKHLIFVDNCLVQSIPEHPKRDHVFCLSTAFGDAYLLDAPCLEERDQWIAAVHCACAAQMARSSGKAAVSHVLQEEATRLERAVEAETRLRHETELVLSCVSSDERQRHALMNQLMASEEKSERMRTDQFRLKCYLSAVEALDEMPNPKTILSLTNKRTKSQLNRLGVFTVSSLHAFNCAKNPSIVGSLLKRQKSDDKETTRDDKPIEVDVVMTTTGERRRVDASPEWTPDRLLVHVMGSHATAREYFVAQGGRAAARAESLSVACDLSKALEIVPKVLFTIEVTRDSNEVLFGFSVESELFNDDLCVYVSRVESQSLAGSHGLRRGDELVVINGALVHDLDMMFVESVLQEELALCMMIRSARDDAVPTTLTTPETTLTTGATTDDLIESLVCPPPPDDQSGTQLLKSSELENLIVPKNSVQNATQERQPTTGGDKMRKVVQELVDTEVSYVRALEQLLSNYLEPLSRETTLLSQSDIRVLFGSIKEIIKNQKQFKSELEAVVGRRDDSDDDAQVDVCALADLFVRYSMAFRQYSTFCASHSRAVKLLADEKSPQSVQLREWLARRSSGQLAQSLESYLIKPIQRVLKYPLLLQQMKSFCAKESAEALRLAEALKSVERVAEHINEMQRIHEEYGAIFEHLSRSHARQGGQAVDLSPPALIHYGGVDWLNSLEFLGKTARKGVELHAMCFVFGSCVVFLCKETVSQARAQNLKKKSHVTEVEIIRHQTLIPVIEVQVRAVPQQELERDFRWELIQLKTAAGKRSEKIYRLSNSSAEYRNAFLRTIRQIIRDDVRNMTAAKTTTPTTARRDDDDKHTTPERQHKEMVACGLCGKDVSLGCRAKEHALGGESPVWRRRQDSNSSSR